MIKRKKALLLCGLLLLAALCCALWYLLWRAEDQPAANAKFVCAAEVCACRM